MKPLKELREGRDKAAKAYRDLVLKMQESGEKPDVDARSKMDNMVAEIDSYDEQIRSAEAQRDQQFEEIDSALKEMRSGRNIENNEPENRADKYAADFRSYLMSGDAENLIEKEMSESRAMTSTTGSTGGYLIPDKFHNELKEYQQDLCPIYNLATKTDWDADAVFPVVSAFGTTELVTEGSAVTESTPTIGQTTMTGYQFMWAVDVPYPLLRKSAYNLDGKMPKWWGKSNAGVMEDYFAAGTGSSEPTGLTAAATTGTTSASSTVVGDDILNWFYKLDPAYRKLASWVFSPSSVLTIRKLKNPVTTSGALQYLWVPGLAGQPDTLLGRPLYESDGMPAHAAGAVPGVVGDISEFQIVEFGKPSMIRDPYTLAKYGQVSFIGCRLVDCDLPVAEAVVTCPVSA
jgi:HK97 family phage major capsid protein